MRVFQKGNSQTKRLSQKKSLIFIISLFVIIISGCKNNPPTLPGTPTPSFTSTPVLPTATTTITSTASPTSTVVCGGSGEGTANINPIQVTVNSTGNTLSLIYTAGPTSWADSPGFGTLRISIPAGWSYPSLTPSASGFFIVECKGGTLSGQSVSGGDILIYIYGLPANTGSIIVNYGSAPGPGADAQSATGEAKFTVGMNANGTSTIEICDSPKVAVIP